MTAIELKTLLIHRITEINDVSFLKALKTIVESKTEKGVVQLTPDQLDDIISSNKEDFMWHVMPGMKSHAALNLCT
jgi:hypothetical protein